MTVLARIAPHRVSQRMSFVIVDPMASGGLAMARRFRSLGISAVVVTSISHGVTAAHRNKNSIVVVREAAGLNHSELALLSRISSRRPCFLMAERDCALAKSGLTGAKVVSPSLEAQALVDAVRWSMNRAAHPLGHAKTPKMHVHVSSTSERAAGAFDMDAAPVVQVRASEPRRRKTMRYIPAVSYRRQATAG